MLERRLLLLLLLLLLLCDMAPLWKVESMRTEAGKPLYHSFNLSWIGLASESTSCVP